MSTETPISSRIVAEPVPKQDVMLLDWYVRGFKRQQTAIIGALIAAWTGLPFALWLAAAGFFIGGVVGFIGVTVHAGSFGIFGTIVGSPGGGLLGALLGAILGTVGGFLLIYYFLATHPLQFAGALIGGAIFSMLVFFALTVAEMGLMQLRGCRPPSRRERAKLSPLLIEVGSRMGMPSVPAYWIDESKKPGAWMYLRWIVLSRGILGEYDASEEPPKPDLDDAAIAAILAHELNHWQMADVVGLQMITACFLPFVCIVNAIQWIRLRAEWTGVILWCFFWPVWLCSRFLIAPLMASASRDYEFQADARAASLGEKYRLGLRRALTELSSWEVPRTGWEEVLAATHPPIEHRLDRLTGSVRDRAAAIGTGDATPKTETTRPRKPRTQRVSVTQPPVVTTPPGPVETAPTPESSSETFSPTAVETEGEPHEMTPSSDDDADIGARWSPTTPARTSGAQAEDVSHETQRKRRRGPAGSD